MHCANDGALNRFGHIAFYAIERAVGVTLIIRELAEALGSSGTAQETTKSRGGITMARKRAMASVRVLAAQRIKGTSL